MVVAPHKREDEPSPVLQLKLSKKNWRLDNPSCCRQNNSGHPRAQSKSARAITGQNEFEAGVIIRLV
jgi:hypothetical protein